MNKEIALLALKDKISEEDLFILSTKDNADFSKICLLDLKSPLTGLILGLFLGVLGVDRFYKGDIFLGIIKIFVNLITFGIWWLLDLFLVYHGIKKDNFQKILMVI
ncbi:TM2 domain-containing protein [Campylobacter sp. RM5004]|uniref:NINE protein n=1 Tax=Campylobacter sp. RM5004 TaxID=1660078 RepID=UPI001EFBD637|nr:TM2 domain-containing protein [Campylobacter sp. RM5004]ULO01925.1 TM2 domain-containing protein [Campylobacter sp. RM5004]